MWGPGARSSVQVMIVMMIVMMIMMMMIVRTGLIYSNDVA